MPTKKPSKAKPLTARIQDTGRSVGRSAARGAKAAGTKAKAAWGTLSQRFGKKDEEE